MENNVDTLNLDEVRARLIAALGAKGVSMRAVSLEAGAGPGYMHSILKDGKEPTIGMLSKVCQALDVSLIHVLYGANVSPETEQIIRHLGDNPEKVASLLALLRS